MFVKFLKKLTSELENEWEKIEHATLKEIARLKRCYQRAFIFQVSAVKFSNGPLAKVLD